MAPGVGGIIHMLDQPKCAKQGCEADPFTVIYRVKMNIKITKEDQPVRKTGGLFQKICKFTDKSVYLYIVFLDDGVI